MSTSKGGPPLNFWEHTAVAALAFEVGGLALYAAAIGSITAFAILFLLALAATGGGGMLGFLFGVPRLKTGVDIGSVYQPNSNLEQISDWLTKILIGATLVQIDDIARGLGGVSVFIGSAIGVDGSATAAGSVIIFSFIGGFMWAYLWTSLRLRDQFDAVNEVHRLLGLDRASRRTGEQSAASLSRDEVVRGSID